MLKNFLYLAIFSTFLVFVVVGLNVYHNFSTSTVSKDASIQVIPLTPSFDTEVIQMLKSRTVIQANLGETVTFPTGVPALPSIGPPETSTTPTPALSQTPTPTVISTVSATPAFFPPGL